MRLIYFTLILVNTSAIYFVYHYYSTQLLSKFARNIPTTNLYVTCNFRMISGAGLGNQLLHYASIYAIGRTTNRQPYITFASRDRECELQRKSFDNMRTIFPRLHAAFRIFDRNLINETRIKFENYDNESILIDYSSIKYLRLSGSYFSSSQYYHRYRDEIINLMKFTEMDLIEAEIEFNRIQSQSNKHNLCVHVRRTDLITEHRPRQHTTEQFTRSAIKFLITHLTEVTGQSVIVIVFGDDWQWVENQILTNASLSPIYNLPPPTRPSVHLAFASRYCNSVLLTTSLSTFGLWISYLSKSDRIFYNYQLYKANNTKRNIRTEFRLFPHYRALRYDAIADRIEMIQ